MEGQVALVTGGTRGIGLAIAERLLARGVTVAAGYSSNREAAERLAERPNVSVHQGNIGNHEDCERVVNDVIGRYGRLDILVNNAGVTADRTVRKMSPDEWDHVIGTNLSGAFYMCRSTLPHMIGAGYGRIVNISSVVGEMGNIGQANYAASKSGLFGLTMTLALETASSGITVNVVAPGYTETEMVATIPEKVMQQVIAQIPCGRLAEADEVARVVEFLVDPRSAYITGAVYSVNGGVNM